MEATASSFAVSVYDVPRGAIASYRLDARRPHAQTRETKSVRADQIGVALRWLGLNASKETLQRIAVAVTNNLRGGDDAAQGAFALSAIGRLRRRIATAKEAAAVAAQKEADDALAKKRRDREDKDGEGGGNTDGAEVGEGATKGGDGAGGDAAAAAAPAADYDDDDDASPDKLPGPPDDDDKYGSSESSVSTSEDDEANGDDEYISDLPGGARKPRAAEADGGGIDPIGAARRMRREACHHRKKAVKIERKGLTDTQSRVAAKRAKRMKIALKSLDSDAGLLHAIFDALFEVRNGGWGG